MPRTIQDESAKLASEKLVSERMSALRTKSVPELLKVPEFTKEILSIEGRKYRVDVSHMMTKNGEHWIIVDAGLRYLFGFASTLAGDGLAFGPNGERALTSEEVECWDDIALWSPKPNL